MKPRVLFSAITPNASYRTVLPWVVAAFIAVVAALVLGGGR